MMGRRTGALTVGYFLGTYSFRKSSQESISIQQFPSNFYGINLILSKLEISVFQSTQHGSIREYRQMDGQTDGRMEAIAVSPSLFLKKAWGQLTHYDETKKWAHDQQIVRAKENLKLGSVVPAKDKHQAQTNGLKLYVRYPCCVSLFYNV